MSLTLNARIQLAADRLGGTRNLAVLAQTNGRTDGQWPKKLDKVEQAIEAFRDAITATSLSPTPAPVMSSHDRNASAVAAFTAWVKDKGAAIVPWDSAHRMVVTYCPEADRGYWSGQAPAVIAGLVASVIAPELEAQGVLTWRPNPDDHYIRVVDTNHLHAHADIRRWVDSANWRGGFRCRFCGIQEVQSSLQLQVTDPEQRLNWRMEGGKVHLQPGRVYTHEQCRKHWFKWLDIANRYASQEEAEAADKAAGREPTAPRPMPDLEPVKALPAGYTDNSHHSTAAEQGR